MSALHPRTPVPDQNAPIQEATVEEVREKIVGFERKYGMTSEEFKILWERGEAPDTFETNLWSTLLQYV